MQPGIAAFETAAIKLRYTGCVPSWLHPVMFEHAYIILYSILMHFELLGRTHQVPQVSLALWKNVQTCANIVVLYLKLESTIGIARLGTKS